MLLTCSDKVQLNRLVSYLKNYIFSRVAEIKTHNETRTFFLTSLIIFTVFQDNQANAELAKIMGEFSESEEPVPSSSSKGDDLLAMMDGL